MLTPIEQGILDFLIEYPTAYIDEVAAFVNEEYDIQTSRETIRKAMKNAHLTRKTISRIPTERDETLRRRWAIELCTMSAEQLVFVDESAANERTMNRRMGWSPRGFPCKVRMPGRHSVRWSILPAITIEGYISWDIYQGSIDGERFNHFIEQLLLIMNPWPGKYSVKTPSNRTTSISIASYRS